VAVVEVGAADAGERERARKSVLYKEGGDDLRDVPLSVGEAKHVIAYLI